MSKGDDSSYCSGLVDLPSELTVTIDNNLQKMMPVHSSGVQNNMRGVKILTRRLNRKVGTEYADLTTVVGFNCSAPRTILMHDNHAKAIVDRGSSTQSFLTNNDDDNDNEGIPLFCQLLTSNIITTLFLGEQRKIKLLSCGFDHCLAVTSPDGQVFTWGYGASGCLGHGVYES